MEEPVCNVLARLPSQAAHPLFFKRFGTCAVDVGAHLEGLVHSIWGRPGHRRGSAAQRKKRQHSLPVAQR